MSLSRRRFLKVGLSGAFVITAGNVLRPLGKDLFSNISRDKQVCRFAIASDGHFGQASTNLKHTITT